MYKNDVGNLKGGVYVHEDYEAKEKLPCEHMGPTSFFILLAFN
jgi:hypothetical protein